MSGALLERNASRSGNSGDLLGPARIALARRLRARRVEVQQAVFEHIRDAIPDDAVEVELASGLREVIVGCTDCALSTIEQGRSASIPSVVAAHALSAASRGVSLKNALRHCVDIYTLAWSFVLDEFGDREQGLPLLLWTSEAMGSLLAAVQAEIADAHSSEIKRRARSREQCRADTVHTLLADEAIDAAALGELGYELARWHLAVIAVGSDAGRTLGGLAAGLGCELLSVAAGRDTVWGWLGGRQRLAFADVEQAFCVRADTSVSLAIGEPGKELEGWRQTHREAEGALLVARCRPRKLTRYLHVATEATALQDDALADSLIETYLAPLDAMRIGGQAARRTLIALFESGHNVSSAAFALKVDRSTVHRQRTEVERRLGCLVHEHQADIEVALRIEELRERRDTARAQTPDGVVRRVQ